MGFVVVIGFLLIVPLKAQETEKPGTQAKPSQPIPSPAASPQSTPFVIPKSPELTRSPTGTSTSVMTTPGTSVQAANTLSLDDALRLANAQASAFQQATLTEKIAEEDVRQAKEHSCRP